MEKENNHIERFFKKADEEIMQDNRFILQGRRPLVNYPLVWLTAQQLETILSDYLGSGLGQPDITKAFLLAQSRLESYQLEDRNLQRVNILEWFFGWIKTNLLEAKNAELKVRNKMED